MTCAVCSQNLGPGEKADTLIESLCIRCALWWSFINCKYRRKVKEQA